MKTYKRKDDAINNALDIISTYNNLDNKRGIIGFIKRIKANISWYIYQKKAKKQASILLRRIKEIDENGQNKFR